MKEFTLEDYEKALQEAGPKLREELFTRAAEDSNIGILEFIELHNRYDTQQAGRRREHGAEE